MQGRVIYLANGKLRMLNEQGEARTLESRFSNELINRALKEQQRHEWKNRAGDDKMISSAALWGKGGSEKPVRIALTSIARGNSGDEFLYTLETDHVCAILKVSNEGAEEQRIWNNNLKKLSFLSLHPTFGHVACSVVQKTGTANIAVRLGEESGLAEVTEGDSVDTAPSWVPGNDLKLVFQSAGVGRNKEGFIGGLGPFCIQKLTLENGELECLLENAKFDYLKPIRHEDGTLYCIKRPYTGFGSSPLTMIKDIVLFPFRLSRAFFGFLNFFSMMYSGKQLKTVKQAGAAKMDLPEMMIWGNLVKAQRADDPDKASPLVPKSWQLIRMKEGGAEEVIAERVLSYDLAQDGGIYFSDGATIYSVDRNGAQTRVASDKMIEQVIFLRTQNCASQEQSAK